jgi:hypothetical protein
MLKRVTSLGLAACLLACVGCVQMGAGLTSSTLPITGKDTYTEIGPAEGSDSALGLLNFAIWPYGAYDAIQDAKKKSGADGLINVTAENKVYWVTLVFPLITWHKITVAGTAIKFKRGAGE